MGRVGDGVEAREKSIRLKFVDAEGRSVKERLTVNGKSLPPTPANLKYAARVAIAVRRRVALGTFEYAEFFPDSPRAAKEQPGSFGKLAELWLKSKGRLSDATRSQYANAVDMWTRMLGEHTKTGDLTYPVLAAKIGGHPWASPKSANNYLIVLRGILAMEYHGKRAAENPMIGIENMKTVKKPPDPLTADERDAILSDMAKHYDPRIGAYYAFAFFTGMRPEELIALRWGDIDWRGQTAHVGRVRTFRGSERDGSKTHTERDVDLVSRAMDALRAMKPYTFMKRRENGEDADVFENPVTGRPWHDERSQRDHYWKPSLKRLGIRYRRAYNTRHTFATAALMAGLKPAYIARQLGHASTAMLFSVYGKWIDGADKDTERQALEAALCSNSSHESPKKANGPT